MCNTRPFLFRERDRPSSLKTFSPLSTEAVRSDVMGSSSDRFRRVAVECDTSDVGRGFTKGVSSKSSSFGPRILESGSKFLLSRSTEIELLYALSERLVWLGCIRASAGSPGGFSACSQDVHRAFICSTRRRDCSIRARPMIPFSTPSFNPLMASCCPVKDRQSRVISQPAFLAITVPPPTPML